MQIWKMNRLMSSNFVRMKGLWDDETFWPTQCFWGIPDARLLTSITTVCTWIHIDRFQGMYKLCNHCWASPSIDIRLIEELILFSSKFKLQYCQRPHIFLSMLSKSSRRSTSTLESVYIWSLRLEENVPALEKNWEKNWGKYPGAWSRENLSIEAVESIASV